MKTAAAWLFVLPVFTEGLGLPMVKLEIAGLAVLAFAVLLRGPLPERAVERVFPVFAVLALVVIGYLAFGHWPAQAGSTASYDKGAVLFVVTCVTVAMFAAFFFDEEIFARVMWRAATVTLWAGLVTCVFSRLTGRLLLVNPAHDALRMYGTMGEPSAWAPVLTLIALLALRRRSWLYLLLALAGLFLADSPVCLLVMAVTLPLYAALASTWRHRALLLAALPVIIGSGVFFVLHADQQAWLDSGNSAKIAVGRLLSGITSAETGGQQGSNARFTGTTEIIAITGDNRWRLFGAGPSADTTYFPALYPGPDGTTALEPNALWVSVLFDFGETGVAVLALLAAGAAWRMRRRSEMSAVFLPFLVATAVNSGGACTAMVMLAIMIFAFGWGRCAGRLAA